MKKQPKKSPKVTVPVKPATKAEAKLVRAMTKLGPIKFTAKIPPVNKAVAEKLSANIAREYLDCEPHFAIVMHRVPGNPVVTTANFDIYVNGEHVGMVEQVDLHLSAKTASAIVSYVTSEIADTGPVKQVTHNLTPWMTVLQPDGKR